VKIPPTPVSVATTDTHCTRHPRGHSKTLRQVRRRRWLGRRLPHSHRLLPGRSPSGDSRSLEGRAGCRQLVRDTRNPRTERPRIPDAAGRYREDSWSRLRPWR